MLCGMEQRPPTALTPLGWSLRFPPEPDFYGSSLLLENNKTSGPADTCPANGLSPEIGPKLPLNQLPIKNSTKYTRLFKPTHLIET